MCGSQREGARENFKLLKVSYYCPILELDKNSEIFPTMVLRAQKGHLSQDSDISHSCDFLPVCQIVFQSKYGIRWDSGLKPSARYHLPFNRWCCTISATCSCLSFPAALPDTLISEVSPLSTSTHPAGQNSVRQGRSLCLYLLNFCSPFWRSLEVSPCR